MATEERALSSQTCPACGTTVDTTEAEPLARLACPKCGEKVRAERSFNNFVLIETLGIGGMGTVYKARDTLLDRLVALKLLRKDLGGQFDYGARLQQEARVSASVNHPNVIQVFSSGTDHGQFYLVMELVDHGSLDDFIEQRKRLPEELVLETGIQVAKGLRAAHRKGLIHRDVKPANILFADEHTAKIGDFGLAGVAAEKAETRGEIWGTPYYVAPERLNNQLEDLRSDIYSLGATLFHAAAGKAPIEGETNSAIALRELKNKPLDLRAIAPEISAATARVFHRMIAPDPAQRFSSYDELVAELQKAQRALTGKESVDLDSAHRQRWRYFLAGAALLVAVIAVAGFFLVGKTREQAAHKVTAASVVPSILTSELERRFDEAKRQLLGGKHNLAHAAFARIAIDAAQRQPLTDWVRLHEGLAAMIGREPSQARQAFQEVENAGQMGFSNEDADLAGFFVSTAKTLSAPGIVSASSVRTRSDNFEAFALLLFAIKDIAQSDVNNATTLLEQFLAAQPTGKFAWIADDKPLAQKYLDDCRLYTAWKIQAKETEDAVALSTNLENLRGIKQKLKTDSAISEAISTEEKTLARRVAEKGKTEGVIREQERKKALDLELPAWNAALAKYKQKVMLYDFAGARDAINGAKVSESSLRQTQVAAQKKAQWLMDWKSKLIDDINRTHFSGAIADVNNVPYSGVAGANAENLALQVPYGTVQTVWTKLAPKTLLALSTWFIKPNAADAADRQWLAAVFAAETGQTDVARQLAEAAAKAKPEYHDQESMLFSSSPPPR